MNELGVMWGGEAHFTPSSGKSMGLVTLFHSKYREKDIALVFKSNRIIISSIQINKETIYVVNTYCPCKEQEKVKFLNDLYTIIKQHCGDNGDANVLCLGDFNIAACDLDVISGQIHKKDTCQGFINFITSMGLTDTWRHLHQNEKDFTWSRPNPPTAKRLDYVLAGESLINSLTSSTIKTIGFSDHRIVVSNFDFLPFRFGKGIYKINTSLFKDADYCKLIIEQIHSTLEEYQEVNPHLRWEMVKINVKEISQQFSRHKAKERARNHVLLAFR